jgi:hypothetical protein
MNHLDEMACLLYLEGQLERGRAKELSAHVEQCGECRTLLRALERESRLLARSLLEEDEAVPARLLSPPGPARNTLRWAWVISLGLAATGAYALYTGYIEPWQQQLDQAGFGGNNLLGLLVFQGAFWKGWQSMITLIEILAMLTLGGVGAVFLRRRFRRWTALAVVMTGLIASLALPAPATAADIRKAQGVTVTKDQVIKNDLVATGGRIRIEGTIDGDLIVFCQSLDVTGHVTGDVISFSRDARISGTVDGNVRSFTNNITISGTVGKNVMSFTDPFTLDSSAKIGGSLIAFSNFLALDGNVGRDVTAYFHRASLNGRIGGGMQARGDSLAIGPTAEIAGKAVYGQTGREAPEVSSSAKLLGGLETNRITHRPDYTKPRYYIWKIIWAAAAFLFGLVAMFLMPKFSEDTVRSASRYGASFGVGVLVFFGVPLAAVIVCITVVGIGVAFATTALWAMALYATQVVVGAWLGEKLLGRASGTGALVGRMALGLVIIRILGMIPHLSFWVWLAVFFWGMGALSLAIYRRLQSGSAGPPAMAIEAPLPA